MQSGRGGGLADALKQYGVLRSHSITQQAGIQIEENRSLGCSEIFYLDNSIERETSEVSIGRLRFCTTLLATREITNLGVGGDNCEWRKREASAMTLDWHVMRSVIVVETRASTFDS